ncbi:GIY-YIG nuclease family protein [Flavobacteriales bacterium]|nr:GIY-YIG nuclease family protein [Flavobacteriales bacterium]
MDKDSILDDIFNNDPLGLLNVKAKTSNVKSADQRLSESFDEINSFYNENNREPEANISNVTEYQLYSRLKGLRESVSKSEMLESEDIYNLLNVAPKEINSIDDILGDNFDDILNTDDAGLFDFKHTPEEYERAQADFVARRKKCKDFDKYEYLFKEVQSDLANGKRQLIDFKESNLRKGSFYVHNGIVMYLNDVNFTDDYENFPSGKRSQKNGRTHCVFENGTESNMLYRSLMRALYLNGKVVTQNMDKVNEKFIENFSDINSEDEISGYIYILKSLSTDTDISAINDLFKIGYSDVSIASRIKNAENEPTYLMAPVKEVAAWKCFNMNTQKFEQLIHNFFGSSCLNVKVRDNKGIHHNPKEWFIAPLKVIEQAVELIISGEVIHYRYDSENKVIVKR